MTNPSDHSDGKTRVKLPEKSTQSAGKARQAEVDASPQKRQVASSANPDATRVSIDAKRIAARRAQARAAMSRQSTSQDPHDAAANTLGDNDATRIATQVKNSQATRVRPSAAGARDQQGSSPRTVFKGGSGPEQTQIQKTLVLGQSDRLSQEDSPEPRYKDQHVLKKRFVLERVLGAGGMGIVYKAKDLLKVEAKDRDPYVAIKVLSEEFKEHPEAFISLQRESRKSQRIAHPNIVNVHDFDRDGDTVFMTMEFLDGHALDELIRRYKTTGLPTDDAWDIIAGMTAALKYAHEGQIIHSDFKPGNVFVTKTGLTKVFDFGIARAVAQVEHMDGAQQDHTVFDAGNLGALTPAYASLEMLEGKVPDVRDDVYALGCVAYEVLTGQHPYNKMPADEAERQKIKPKRITNIKKFQWQAIESAIALRRENRMASVEEFESAIAPKIRSSNWIITGLALLFAAGISGYFLYFAKEPEAPAFSEFDIRNELELKVRIDFYKENINKLLLDASFTDLWQESIWKDISDLKKLIQGEDPWLNEKVAAIFGLYIKQIERVMGEARYGQAEQLISSAQRYTSDTTELDRFTAEISRQREIAQQKRIEQARLELERKNKLEQERKIQQQKQQQEKQQAKQDAQILDQFNIGLENVNAQLNCQGSINMRDFEVAINKLQQLAPERYSQEENKIIDSLASCIIRIGKSFPERALDAKKKGLRLFDSPVLAAINIKSRDPCDLSLAGLGTRGKRAMCKDKLKSSGYGPEMVVIPGNQSIDAFAMTKYEISVAEYNQFCIATGSCSKLSQNEQHPVSAISIGQASAYLGWLSKQSGQKYRLPTKAEWLHAAKSRSKKLDPNRNCELSTRGFQKGGDLVNYTVGSQNDWGLVNYVGNVQEWVYASGRKLKVLGGSFLDPMESCTISTAKDHNGSADKATGFRVIREIKG